MSNVPWLSHYPTLQFIQIKEKEPDIHPVLCDRYHHTANTRAVLPQLIEKNGGDIINISSTSGLSGAAISSAYSASKFAVIGFTESLAQEVRRNNIRVSALTPSTVATDLAMDLNLIKENNESKFMQAEDIAEFIVSQLKLNPRVYVKTASFIATNPY